MPHVIWDEDLDEIQNLIDEVRACVKPVPDTLNKKLLRIDKLPKSVRGESKSELESDERFAVLERSIVFPFKNETVDRSIDIGSNPTRT